MYNTDDYPIMLLFEQDNIRTTIRADVDYRNVLIYPIAPKVVCRICVYHFQLWAVTVCNLPFQAKVASTPTNIWAVIVELIVHCQV